MDNNIVIPEKGRNREAILEEMREFGKNDPDYKNGKTWSLVYYLGEAYAQFLNEAGQMYASSNGLNPMAFQSLKRFETEVVRMTATLLNGDDEVAGIMTSGGTESCLLAVKTYRDMARKKGIKKPEMILPESAHVAWEKGAQYFNVKAVHVPLDKDYRVDADKVRKAVNKRTVMILGSAPGYPHGVVDPIEQLGAIALEKKVPLHVDACVGGYLLPFVERLGYRVPKFDFRVQGVTSISADTHKYGFSAKGASTILYRNMDILEHQMFVFTEWPGGIFASPGLLGTRPGGNIAAAWAAMQAMGEDGYLENAKIIMETTQQLIQGIGAIEGLEVVGRPDMSLVAYRSTSNRINIYALGDQMEKKGWHIDRQQKPECLHAMVTPLHRQVMTQYLADLKESLEYVRSNPKLSLQGGAATYGMVSKIPFRGMVKKNVLKMMREMYGPSGKALDFSKSDTGQKGFVEKIARLFLKFKS
ncbi:MAG: aspartate aminotransferase family protein [Proteobacteria bacterium]|nr:aspartate aminotransferase family protein [Desulfobacula sp.]MBU4131136.1 aspartate aminotransferase family protein [Pseudomonadota bacterium]